MKTQIFKIVKEFSSYSKKKGSFEKKITLVKDLDKEAAVKYCKEHFPKFDTDKLGNSKVIMFRPGTGLLFPDNIIITMTTKQITNN
jgi:hypothetical protein